MHTEPEFIGNDAAGPGWGYRPGPHWMAFLAATFTWPLLFVGGLVTTYRIGMAVPDWPTTFGINMFVFNFFNASWAVFGEHTHRLYASAVGLFTILLTLEFLIRERRRPVRWLGVVALTGVIAQGLLGGYRVRLNSTTLAAVHGFTAQAFFGLIVALCVLTGRSWFCKPRIVECSGKYRRLSTAMLGLIGLQLAFGAWLRHSGDRTALIVHSAIALAVLGHGSAIFARIGIGGRKVVPELVPAARAMAVLLVLQFALGVGAWWMLRPYDGIARAVTTGQALVRTGHQANAGLLLASAVVLALRASGQLAGLPGSARSAGISARDLEVVA